MDRTLDQTTLETIALLEARMLRIQHMLFGNADLPEPVAPENSVWERVGLLDRDFNRLVCHVKAYGELLNIYDANPALFDDGQLDPAALPEPAVVATVLASAPAYLSFNSSLVAVTQDHPVPEAAQSAALVQLGGRIRAARATQLAQAAEVAALRARSEAVMRRWYEVGVLGCSKEVADAEGRLAKVESVVRRRERAVDDKDEF